MVVLQGAPFHFHVNLEECSRRRLHEHRCRTYALLPWTFQPRCHACGLPRICPEIPGSFKYVPEAVAHSREALFMESLGPAGHPGKPGKKNYRRPCQSPCRNSTSSYMSHGPNTKTTGTKQSRSCSPRSAYSWRSSTCRSPCVSQASSASYLHSSLKLPSIGPMLGGPLVGAL